MAQTGYTPIQLYYSTTASAVPTNTNLANGELAINITDGKLYYKDNTGTVKLLAGAGGAGIAGGSNTQVQYNSSGNLAGDADLTFDGTTLSTAGLTASGTVTLSGGTANGVTYLNGSKVLTSGSALTFDGTNLGVGTAASYKLHVSGTGTVSSRTYATDATGDASFFVGNNDSKIAGPLVYGSTKTAYGALGSNETAFYSNVSTTIMADGASQVIKFAAGGNTEGLRLTSTSLYTASGINVGIGTSSPAQSLHVKTATSATPITLGVLSNATGLPALSFNGAYASTTMAGIYANGATSTSLYYEVPSGNSHFWGIADSTKMTLDSAGNLGIGTSSPAGKLGVDGASFFCNQASTGTGGKFRIVTFFVDV